MRIQGLSFVLKNVSGGGAAAASKSKDNRKPRDEARIDACWMMLPFSDAMIGSNQTRYNSDGTQKGSISNNIFWRAASLIVHPKVSTNISISECLSNNIFGGMLLIHPGDRAGGVSTKWNEIRCREEEGCKNWGAIADASAIQ